MGAALGNRHVECRLEGKCHMSRRKTDFRALKARRDNALARPELRTEKPRLTKAEAAAVAEAISAGRVTRLPTQRRSR